MIKDPRFSESKHVAKSGASFVELSATKVVLRVGHALSAQIGSDFCTPRRRLQLRAFLTRV